MESREGSNVGWTRANPLVIHCRTLFYLQCQRLSLTTRERTRMNAWRNHGVDQSRELNVLTACIHISRLATVVMRLGSSVPFSQELNKLQEEVKSLSKLKSCPRDFKRTSVERLFRMAEFILDWCSFRLVEQEQQSLQQESARRGSSMNVVGLPASGISEHTEWRWARSTKASIPTRSYFKEIAATIFVPTTLFLILAALLSTILCLNHEKMEKRELSPREGVSNNNIQMVQYAATERGTLKSLSAQPSSPSDSLLRSPRIANERCNPYVRPNPPPYMGPTNLPGIRADF